jgi:hypothetical protein
MMKHRRGSFSIEIVISATVLLAAIGLMASMIPRIGRTWRESRNYQLATHELANQLEHLTSLDSGELTDALANLNVSDELRDELPNVKLAAEKRSEDFGTRIRLEIRWDHGPDSPPLSMTGWLAKGTNE